MVKKLLITVSFLITSLTSYAASNHVIVLIPGAASSGKKIWIKGLERLLGPIHMDKYFQTLESKLKNKQFATIVCPKIEDQDTRNLMERTQDCTDYLNDILVNNPSNRFHLVGHSMGGLVARKLLDDPTLSTHIESVTTISTPHKGTPMASFAVRNYKKKTMIGRILKAFEFYPGKKRYLTDLLAIEDGNQFIASLKNEKRIPIYSISNYINNHWNVAFGFTSAILKNEISKRFPNKSTLNDGMVPTESAVFGTHLGTIEADHMESACIFYASEAKGCDNLLKLLVPHLNALAK